MKIYVHRVQGFIDRLGAKTCHRVSGLYWAECLCSSTVNQYLLKYCEVLLTKLGVLYNGRSVALRELKYT